MNCSSFGNAFISSLSGYPGCQSPKDSGSHDLCLLTLVSVALLLLILRLLDLMLILLGLVLLLLLREELLVLLILGELLRVAWVGWGHRCWICSNYVRLVNHHHQHKDTITWLLSLESSLGRRSPSHHEGEVIDAATHALRK